MFIGGVIAAAMERPGRRLSGRDGFLPGPGMARSLRVALSTQTKCFLTSDAKYIIINTS